MKISKDQLNFIIDSGGATFNCCFVLRRKSGFAQGGEGSLPWGVKSLDAGGEFFNKIFFKNIIDNYKLQNINFDKDYVKFSDIQIQIDDIKIEISENYQNYRNNLFLDLSSINKRYKNVKVTKSIFEKSELELFDKWLPKIFESINEIQKIRYTSRKSPSDRLYTTFRW